jgi:CheY-like chemotaxis protein
MNSEFRGRVPSRDKTVSDPESGRRIPPPTLAQLEPSMSAADSLPMRVFVVDDDPIMNHMVSAYLDQHNIATSSAYGRQDLVRLFAANEPNLVILDLRLGQEDGLDLLREIRSRSDLPVIIITGDRREEIDRVVGLELARMTTSPSPSACANFWHAFELCCGGRTSRARPLSGTPSGLHAGLAAGSSTAAPGASPTLAEVSSQRPRASTPC